MTGNMSACAMDDKLNTNSMQRDEVDSKKVSRGRDDRNKVNSRLGRVLGIDKSSLGNPSPQKGRRVGSWCYDLFHALDDNLGRRVAPVIIGTIEVSATMNTGVDMHIALTTIHRVTFTAALRTGNVRWTCWASGSMGSS